MLPTLTSHQEINEFLGDVKVLSASIRVTNCCNLRCKHCYAAAGKRLKDELTTEEIINMLSELKKIGAIRIFFTGGEPFMRSDLSEILGYATRNGFSVYISTNGTLVNDEVLERIKDLPIKVFQVSIDGTKETDERIRGVAGSFEKSVKALYMAKKILKKSEVTLAYSLLKENVKDISDILDLAIKAKIDTFALIPTVPMGRALENYDLSAEEKSSVFEDIISLYEKKKRETGNNINLSILCSPGVIPSRMVQISDKGNGFVCSFPYILGIDANGDVYPCDGFIGMKQFKIGNIRKSKLEKLASAPLMQKIIADSDKTLNGVCKKCNFLESCAGGCRAHAYIKYGNFSSPDPLCQSFYQKSVFPKSSFKT